MNWRCAAVSLLLAAPARAESPAQAVRFKTADGWTLSALYRAPRPGKAVAVLVHGVASGKGEWGAFSEQLWKLGLGTLALDLRGHGDSVQGPRGREDFRGFDLSGEWPKMENDLSAALAFLRKRGARASRTVWIGASIGANLVSRAADENSETGWVVLLSPGQDYRGVTVVPPKGRKALVAASRPDLYAYETARDLAATRDGPVFLEAARGHGAQMFADPDFLKRLLDWIKSAGP